MSKVLITPSKEGNLVTAYSGNAEFGFIILSQESIIPMGTWIKEVNNRAIMKGPVKALQKLIESNPTLELAGQLVVKEYAESEVPASIASNHFDSSLPYEEQIDGYIKRAGNDGPALMKGTDRILRFTMWDPSGTDCSIAVQHDNVDEIKAFNQAKANLKAELPK